MPGRWPPGHVFLGATSARALEVSATSETPRTSERSGGSITGETTDSPEPWDRALDGREPFSSPGPTLDFHEAAADFDPPAAYRPGDAIRRGSNARRVQVRRGV